jgi:hypothetical protein
MSQAGPPHDVGVLLAEWVLEQLPPERVPALCVEALEAGCRSPAVAVLAGLTTPTRADIEDYLPALLREIGLRRPSHDESLKTLVDAIAHKIVAGEVDPVAGAAHIWALWGYSSEGDDRSVAWLDFRPFIGLASECENPGPHVAKYEADILQEARSLLSRGGLRIQG